MSGVGPVELIVVWTDKDPYSGRERGFGVWYATLGMSGCTRVDCPVLAALEVVRLAIKHGAGAVEAGVMGWATEKDLERWARLPVERVADRKFVRGTVAGKGRRGAA